MTISILGRDYSIDRIPLRLVLNGRPCDARIDYAAGDILIGDPEGMSRDDLLECVAEAISTAARYELDQPNITA